MSKNVNFFVFYEIVLHFGVLLAHSAKHQQIMDRQQELLRLDYYLLFTKVGMLCKIPQMQEDGSCTTARCFFRD